MSRELNEEELKAVTEARLSYEEEIEVKLIALRDIQLFQAGFRAGLDYSQATIDQLEREQLKSEIERLKDNAKELAYLLSRGR